MMYGYGNYGSYGFDPFYGLLHFLFFIVIVAFVIMFVRRLCWGSPWRRSMHRWGNSALSILEERYAKGEINKEEFEQKRKDLLMQ